MSVRVPRPRPCAPARRAPGARCFWVLVCLAASACFASHAQAAGATYYVSPAGSDANAGSSAFPFRQIRRALQVVAPGDTVQIADGSYLGFDVFVNGAASAPINLQATGTNAQVIPTTD